MKLFRILALLVALGALILPFASVLADQAYPDEDPTIKEFNVYRHLLQDDDWLILIYADGPTYATTPNATATDAFIWRLYATDNTTELASTTCFSYHDKGYGFNLISMYFDNSTTLVWGTTYYVRLSGNPSVFTTPPVYTFQISAADYSTSTTQADSQDELYDRIIDISRDLYSQWSLTSATTLLLESEFNTYLSLDGQAYFRGSIYGIQVMCPELFPFELGDIEITDRDWELNYSGNLTTQWTGTWVQDAKDAGEDFFELDYDMGSIALVIVLAVAVLAGNIMLAGETWAGLIDVSIVLVAMARLGMYPMVFLGLLAAMGVVFIAIKIWGIGR